MSKKKKRKNILRSLLPKSKLDRNILLATIALVVVIGGFVIYLSRAASLSTLYTYQENSSGIRHSNGARVYDSRGNDNSSVSNNYAWEAVNASGYSWWGPYKDGHPSGNFRACFYNRRMTSGADTRIYMDVAVNGNVIKSTSVTSPGGYGYYYSDCLNYSLSNSTNNVEWRLDVREGKVRTEWLRVYKITE